jgi:hypothetical protein
LAACGLKILGNRRLGYERGNFIASKKTVTQTSLPCSALVRANVNFLFRFCAISLLLLKIVKYFVLYYSLGWGRIESSSILFDNEVLWPTKIARMEELCASKTATRE